MTNDETVRELFQIIDKLINLLTIQSTSDFVFDDSGNAEIDPPGSEQVDCVAGYGISTTWEIEDEIIRDPDLPEIGDPEEQ